jgi:hypothetical protein
MLGDSIPTFSVTKIQLAECKTYFQKIKLINHMIKAEKVWAAHLIRPA